jgi:hypothetical protein
MGGQICPYRALAAAPEDLWRKIALFAPEMSDLSGYLAPQVVATVQHVRRVTRIRRLLAAMRAHPGDGQLIGDRGGQCDRAGAEITSLPPSQESVARPVVAGRVVGPDAFTASSSIVPLMATGGPAYPYLDRSHAYWLVQVTDSGLISTFSRMFASSKQANLCQKFREVSNALPIVSFGG